MYMTKCGSRENISQSGQTQGINRVGLTVASNEKFYINQEHSKSVPYLSNVAGRGAMVCVCGMTFRCGRTMVNVSLPLAPRVILSGFGGCDPPI